MVLAATACLPLDLRPTQFGQARATPTASPEREFFERVAQAASITDIAVAAHIALHEIDRAPAA